MDLNSIYRNVKDAAYIEGDFVTRAGKKTSYYIDKFQFETQPDVLKLVIEGLASLLPDPSQYDRLICPALGAVSLTTPLAVRVQKPFAIIRDTDQNKPLNECIAGTLQPNDRVILIEDVLTTGSTVIDVCNRLAPMSLEIVRIIAAINREEGAVETLIRMGHDTQSLITTTQLREA